MARDKKTKKDKNEKKEKKGRKLFGRKSSVAQGDKDKKQQPTPESSNKADSQTRRKSKLGGLLKSRKSSAVASAAASSSTKSKDKTKSSKGSSKGKSSKSNVKAQAPPVSVETSYNRNKQRRPKKGKKKAKKKQEIIIKRGDVQRVKNNYYPGDVSFRYESPPENWVAYLGTKPVVNDYGNGARLMLDETDE